IDDDQRGSKRGLSVTLKGLRAWVVFQKPMQGGRRHPCYLREPLRRPAGGSRRKERQMLLRRHGGERLAEERLARSGPASHHRQRMSKRGPEGVLLFSIQATPLGDAAEELCKRL